MLSSLSIKNYALIESLQISFGNGFTAITGETGAGKSILLGALSLVLGNRADSNVLRDKHKKCVVEAIFDIRDLSLKEIFKISDLDYDNQSSFRREILPSGKSRAFVNDTPVGLNVMKELGEKLVDIHSQHQTLLLGKSDFQLELFDSFINRPDVLENFKKTFENYNTLKTKLKTLQSQKEQSEKEEDFLQFQLAELQAASESISAFEALKRDEQILSHAEEIAKSMDLTVNLLSEKEMSTLQQIADVNESLSKVSPFHAGIKALNQRIESLFIELKDIVNEVETIGENISYNPTLALEINEKLNSVYRLQQKHHVQKVEDLIQLKTEFADRLNQMEVVDSELEETQKLFEISKTKTFQKAYDLSRLRKKHTASFEKKMEELLKRLGMPHAQLKVKQEETQTCSALGQDNITFLFTANKGSKPEEIDKIASGGELSRLMLALKAMVQQSKLLPTIIFDEIDSGVSGEIAGMVGTILTEMSERLQVIAITHLPQIAAKAKYHLKVFKETLSDKTATNLSLLSDDGRILELAKLISDKKVTDAAMQAAKDLMQVDVKEIQDK